MRNYFIVLIIFLIPAVGFSQDAKEALKTGKALFENQEYMEAIVNLNQVIDTDPSNAQAYYFRGRIK